MEKKLYVLVSKKLPSVYGCVQGGHAVAQWLLDNPEQSWDNGYLIYLHADVEKWQQKLDTLNVDYSHFCEPDLDNLLTAIAVLSDGKLFRNLKLVS
jgi:hypothetical protein